MMNNGIFDKLVSSALDLGAEKAAVTEVDNIELNASFRDMCALNYCGVYGKCWMCPPDVGDIYEMMNEIRGYSHALIYQIVGKLEDSFDVEGMHETGMRLNRLASRLKADFASISGVSESLHLGAGGCRVCEVCAKRVGEPCRSPEKAISSLEAYGIDVKKTAERVGMKYMNGTNTVTFFGVILFRLPSSEA